VQDKRLIEYHFDETEHQFAVGAEKAGRRKQEPKGVSTPDQAEKEKDPQGS
jgi:hypothetical protein